MDWIPNVNNPQWTVTDKQRTPMYNDDNGAMQTKNNEIIWQSKVIINWIFYSPLKLLIVINPMFKQTSIKSKQTTVTNK